jgi:hypothetical protein
MEYLNLVTTMGAQLANDVSSSGALCDNYLGHVFYGLQNFDAHNA